MLRVERCVQRFLVFYAVSMAVATTALIALGESRLDVYVSIYILEYYVFRALTLPEPVAKVLRGLVITDAAYFIVFAVIVAYRVAEILWPHAVWWPWP